MQVLNVTRLNGKKYKTEDLEDAKLMTMAQHGKDAEHGLFHIKPININCSSRHHSEKL